MPRPTQPGETAPPVVVPPPPDPLPVVYRVGPVGPATEPSFGGTPALPRRFRAFAPAFAPATVVTLPLRSSSRRAFVPLLFPSDRIAVPLRASGRGCVPPTVRPEPRWIRVPTRPQGGDCFAPAVRASGSGIVLSLRPSRLTFGVIRITNGAAFLPPGPGGVTNPRDLAMCAGIPLKAAELFFAGRPHWIIREKGRKIADCLDVDYRDLLARLRRAEDRAHRGGSGPGAVTAPDPWGGSGVVYGDEWHF